MDVNLISKDMEINFSNKQDDDDEIEARVVPGELPKHDGDGLRPSETIDLIDDSDLAGAVSGVPEEMKITEKMKILEEQKDSKKQAQQKQTPGRSKLQVLATVEPKIQPQNTTKKDLIVKQ